MSAECTSNPKVLMVDDEADALLSLSRALKNKIPQIQIDGAGNSLRALECIERSDPAVVILDLSLDTSRGVESGFELLRQILSVSPRCRVIVLTGHSSAINGVQALKLGASHFLEKPADLDHLAALVNDCIKQSELYRAYESSQSESENSLLKSELVGASPAIAKLREEVLFAASNNQAVLLAGETGTGKTLCASLIHRLSTRAAKRFICYSPGFGGSSLVNSDLFGHLKGSFTGASDSRVGLLLEADGGTFFVDEVDELPQDTQVALLRAVETKIFRALGSDEDRHSNFRLISATNVLVDELVAKGKLRQDFFHRIAHRVIRLPSLKERREDIRLLSKSFLQRLAEKEQLRVYSIEDAAIKLLEKSDWPGNIRQLQSSVEGAAFFAQFQGRNEVLVGDLQLEQQSGTASKSNNSFHKQVEDFKYDLVMRAMETSEQNQVQAAKLLGLDRSSLRRILGKE